LKALEVLELLAEAEDGLRLTDVAESAGYPLSTVRRLLSSLIERGYVEQESATSRYYLGTKILMLQAQGIRQRHVGRRAYPFLVQLRRQLDETVNLGVLSETSVIYLETLSPDTSFAFYATPGTRMPLHCTAMGKAFLANLPATTRRALMESLELKPQTPRSITSVERLEQALDEIARQGYAIDDEEYALGVRCVAAPVFNHDRRMVAGVSVTALATRLTPERMPVVAVALQQTCLEISQALGFQHAPPHGPALARVRPPS
jgi:IclR family transcriptional regulator, KDG regulon repressor